MSHVTRTLIIFSTVWIAFLLVKIMLDWPRSTFVFELVFVCHGIYTLGRIGSRLMQERP